MSTEEGEISEPANSEAPPQGYNDYNPEFAWPGEDTEPSATLPEIPLLRLIVMTSTILPAQRRLAVLDAYTEIQIGRDAPPPASTTPRIRLKELAVSKLHATLYWDPSRREWAIVDMGSKHGTFIASASSASSSTGPGQRLSAPRAASLPRKLKHLDQITLGGTTFVVHIHESRLPCDECALPATGDVEIPLFADAEKAAAKLAQKRKAAEEEEARAKPVTSERDARKALTSLRREMLSRPKSETGTPSTEPKPRGAYVDRAAKRRQLHPGSAVDSPGVQTPASHTAQTAPLKVPLSAMIPPSPPRSAPAVPLAASNVGHKLLMKQGWTPGSALGVDVDEDEAAGRRLVEPIQATMLPAKAGLGSSKTGQPVLSATERRWKDALGR
ncbi:unnamed protein product [Peniophora sp. CBMAI 1063]|nr:unnamed protein product [Peniophora sp. CBMAI 1063]